MLSSTPFCLGRDGKDLAIASEDGVDDGADSTGLEEYYDDA